MSLRAKSVPLQGAPLIETVRSGVMRVLILVEISHPPSQDHRIRTPFLPHKQRSAAPESVARSSLLSFPPRRTDFSPRNESDCFLRGTPPDFLVDSSPFSWGPQRAKRLLSKSAPPCQMANLGTYWSAAFPQTFATEEPPR